MSLQQVIALPFSGLYGVVLFSLFFESAVPKTLCWLRNILQGANVTYFLLSFLLFVDTDAHLYSELRWLLQAIASGLYITVAFLMIGRSIAT